MRILYISGEKVPGNVGGSIHVLEVARNLTKLGHEVILLTNRGKGQKSKEIIEGITIHRTNNSYIGMTFPITHIRKLLQIQKINVIIERYSIVGGFGVILSKLYSIPLIIEVNGPHLYEAKYLGQVNNKIIVYLLKKWSDFQFSQARYILAPKKEIVPRKYQQKFKQIEWGVNETHFSKNKKNIKKTELIKRELKIKDRQFVFLFHGSFRAWHGAKDIVKAAKLLDKNNVVFIMICSGNNYEFIRKEINENKLSNIILINDVNYLDLPAYISIADVGFAPFNSYNYEPLRKFGFYWSPLKIFEYMSMELPILTSDIKRLKNLIGINNFFFKEGNIKDLIKKIILISKIKRVELEKIGVINRKNVIKKYTWKGHAKKIEKICKN